LNAAQLEERLRFNRLHFPQQMDSVDKLVGKWKPDDGIPRWGTMPDGTRAPVALREERGMRFAGFTNLPMIDYDWPDAAHLLSSAVSVRHLGDALDLLHPYLKENNAAFQMRLTPGGVHMFDTSRQLTPREFYTEKAKEQLQADPHYVDLTRSLHTRIAGIPTEDGLFWVRTSAKPIRPPAEEFISMPIGTAGTALEDPRQARLLTLFHDNRIAEAMASNPEANQARVHAVNLANRQLQTVSPALRKLYAL
jgi:hypothetical protein